MEKIQTDEAPAPLGAYSQAIVDQGSVYVAGQGPADPETREVHVENIPDQTRQTMENIGAILEAAGTSLDGIVQTTMYLRDMDDFDAANEAYSEYVTEPYPARACIQVSEFPSDIDIEIVVVATMDP